MKLLSCATLLIGVALCCRAADAPVTITQDAKLFTLSNGYLTAQVNRTSGDLTSLKFHGLELMGYSSGHHAGYWEQNPAKAAQLTATVTIDPAGNGGERGEVSIKGISGGKPLDGGDQPGGSMVCDLEIRYSLGRADSGPKYTHFEAAPPARAAQDASVAAARNSVSYRNNLPFGASRPEISPTR